MTPVPPSSKPSFEQDVVADWDKLSVVFKTVLTHIIVVATAVAAALGSLAAILPALHVPVQYTVIVTAVASFISGAITWVRAHHLVNSTSAKKIPVR